MTSYPKSEREARARSIRKLKALRKRAVELLHPIAAFWDEGQVTTSIDMLLKAIDHGCDNITECMDEEILCHEEENIHV
jgi:hypothetical protein